MVRVYVCAGWAGVFTWYIERATYLRLEVVDVDVLVDVNDVLALRPDLHFRRVLR